MPSSGTAHQPTAATAPGHSFFDTYKAYLDHSERRVEQHIVAAGAAVGDFMAVARIENASDFDPNRFSLEALKMLTYITLFALLG